MTTPIAPPIAPMIVRSTLLLSLLAPVALAATGPSFRGLGEPAGSRGSAASSISDDGSVVAGRIQLSDDDDLDYRASRWTAATGNQYLPTLGGFTNSSAAAVSSDGHIIVGQSYLLTWPDEYRACRWTSAGSTVDYLGDAPGGDVYSVATGISATGNMIVGVTSGWDGEQAFRRSATGTPSTLGSLEPYKTSSASAISADGSIVVGSSINAAGRFEPFRWRLVGGMVGLGIPAGYRNTYATDVSPDGSVIVGYAFTDASPSRPHAFRWTSSTGMVILTPPAGYAASLASAVNGDGSVIVGEVRASTSPTAAIWDAEHGWRFLSSVLVDAGLGAAVDGWQLQQATDITPDGRFIVGTASGSGPHYTRAWIADLGEPCPADLTGDGLVDFSDYLEFLNLYEAQDPRADFNGDTFVDFADYLEFLNQYDAGC